MKALERVRGLLRQALQEHASPKQIALAVALGAFIGTSPLLGFHLVVGAALATALRLNRALTMLGTNISFGPILPFVVIGEVQLGSKLLGKVLPPMTLENAVEIAKNAISSWILGFLVIGPVIFTIVGTVSFGLASWRERQQTRGLSILSPTEPPHPLPIPLRSRGMVRTQPAALLRPL